jgi:hypothetical protein
VKDLRTRLARFDRAPAVRRIEPDADPLAGVVGLGARWHGEAPSGYLRIERALGAAPEASDLRGLDPSIPGGTLAVLDTETTGLESGTGTLVFVIGLVLWSGREQRLVQLFLPEPAGEQAFLSALVEELADVDALVSYNGKGFDVPRLRSRMRLHRMDDTCLELPHLDVLYPTRRLVRGWLPDARLKTVEEHLLGIVREGDLPGEFAPEVYRNLQLEGRDTGLGDVVRHNALDVEHLPRLAHRLARVLVHGEWDGLPAACGLEVARDLLDRGLARRARPILEAVIDQDDGAARARARAVLAQSLRRTGDFPAAAECWRAHLKDQPGDLHARVELAKLLEHRLGDLPSALALTAEARTLLSLRAEAHPALCEALDHRYRRLVRRIGRGR